jgi:ligand-binding sensor domain-containing protein
VWVGFNDVGLMQFAGKDSRHYTTRDGLPDSEIFQIREARNGDLLLSTRIGVARMSGKKITNFTPPDALRRKGVFDALEDAQGALWLATPGGLSVRRGQVLSTVVPGGPLLIDFVVSLCEGRDGAIWAGTYGKGLWRVKGDQRILYTTADGLSSDQIRSLYEDAEGTLWIGTFGGGLNVLRNGKFAHYTARDGLLSDNIGKVFDDGTSLWLSTTRGISRVDKSRVNGLAWRHRTTVWKTACAARSARRRIRSRGAEFGPRTAACGSPRDAVSRCSTRMSASRRRSPRWRTWCR